MKLLAYLPNYMLLFYWDSLIPSSKWFIASLIFLGTLRVYEYSWHLLNPNPLMPQLQGRWTSILWPRVPFSSCLSDCLPDRLVKWRYLSKQHILLCRLTEVVTRFRGDCLHQCKTACISETSVNFYETTRHGATALLAVIFKDYFANL
jgi:hypothetical protein